MKYQVACRVLLLFHLLLVSVQAGDLSVDDLVVSNRLQQVASGYTNRFNSGMIVPAGGDVPMGIYTNDSAAQVPAWWSERNVLDAGPDSDYGAVILGQLKWMATNACDELESSLCGGAGAAVTEMVKGFDVADNYWAANIGQLKYVAAKFYDRLIAEGLTNDYPWTSTIEDDVDYAAANVGQMKHVFSFDLTVDSDSDSLPDLWEIAYFGSIASQTGEDDYDNDTYTNLQEYEGGTDPTDSASRGQLTIYVNGTSGSDTNDGFAASWDGTHGPKETINGGLAVTIAGDGMSIYAGTYEETVNFAAKDIDVECDGTVEIP